VFSVHNAWPGSPGPRSCAVASRLWWTASLLQNEVYYW
jgi:hypothetical protein